MSSRLLASVLACILVAAAAAAPTQAGSETGKYLAQMLRAQRAPAGDIPEQFWNVAAKSYYTMMQDMKDGGGADGLPRYSGARFGRR